MLYPAWTGGKKPMGDDRSGEDRRRYERVPLSLLIQYRFDTLDDFLAEYSTNISIGGMFIRAEQPRDLDSLIYLQFYLRDGAKLIEGLGRVVRLTEPDPEADAMVYGMGIEFVNFDDESMRLIQQIVEGKPTAD
jgi:type IV pilus assembly protein PilZ